MVIDPGVLISARLSGRGAPAELIRRWLGGQIELVVSPLLLDELNVVLVREKFRSRLAVEEAEAYVTFLRREAIVVDDPPAEPGLTTDPADDYLVALARASGAHVLVSGDRDLLGLASNEPPVVTPRRLVELLDRADLR